MSSVWWSMHCVALLEVWWFSDTLAEVLGVMHLHCRACKVLLARMFVCCHSLQASGRSTTVDHILRATYLLLPPAHLMLLMAAGVNNAHLVMTGHEWAEMYSNESVEEKYSADFFKQLMQDSHLNFLSHLPAEVQEKFVCFVRSWCWPQTWR